MLLSLVASIKKEKQISKIIFSRPPPPRPLRPYFLSVQPEVKKFVKAFRYLGDVIVACGLNKKIKNNEINLRPPPPPPPRRSDFFATGNKYIF